MVLMLVEGVEVAALVAPAEDAAPAFVAGLEVTGGAGRGAIDPRGGSKPGTCAIIPSVGR